MKKFCLIVIAFCTLFTTMAQQYVDVREQPSIQSPNATGFSKMGEIPVSYFNGTPDISIPLTEITNGPIKVPIVLQYDLCSNV